MARADGSLRGGRDWWNVKQLAEAMGMTHNTAADTLDWLGAMGRLTTERRPTVTADGRLPDIRRLCLLQAYDQPAILTVGTGKTEPVNKTSGSYDQNVAVLDPKNGSPVTNGKINPWANPLYPLVPLHPLGGDVAKANQDNPAEASKTRRELAQRLLKVTEEKLHHPARSVA
jgi:hypothetical protein